MVSIKPKVIIITGSIGTGKSTASNIIKNMGFDVIDSDKIVHEGYEPHKEMYKKVVEYFGVEILNENKEINRSLLGKIVFNDENKLKKLNEIVHYFVVQEILRGVENCAKQNKRAVFLDIPLFFEEKESLINYGIKYNEVWLVYINKILQIERLKQRAILENKNVDDVLNIIKKQIPIENKKILSDEIINNEGSLQELKIEIENLLKKKELI